MYRPQTKRTLVLLSALAIGAPVLGQQNFNIDIGGNQTFGIPANSYGAAALQPGTWNDVQTFAFGQALFDLTGTLTAVSFTDIGTGNGNYESDNQGTSGDDEALLDDFTDLGCTNGDMTSYTISGLPDDDYDIYTYAWASDVNTFRTDVSVTGSSDPVQTVGGAWMGSHAHLVTYALHRVTVSGGSDVDIQTVTLWVGGGGCGSVNGFQIKPSEPVIPPGSNYCISVPNSTGAASTMSATGSPSISANDLVLTADNLPSQPGIFIAGPTQAQLAFFNGFLCIDPQGLQRFVNVASPGGGMISEAVDYATAAMGGLNAVSGSTYNYQRWNRDPAGGGQNANFSDGYVILHTP